MELSRSGKLRSDKAGHGIAPLIGFIPIRGESL